MYSVSFELFPLVFIIIVVVLVFVTQPCCGSLSMSLLAQTDRRSVHMETECEFGFVWRSSDH